MQNDKLQLSCGPVSRSVMWPRLVRRVAGRGVAACCLALCLIVSLLPGVATAQTTLTWGVGGAGGSGTWNTTTSNWYNGSSNVLWSGTSNNAVFAGTSGTAILGTNGLAANSVLFNTAGYTLAFNGRQLNVTSLGGSALTSTTLIASSTATSSANVIINHTADVTFTGTIANGPLGTTVFYKQSAGRFILGEGFNYAATGAFSVIDNGIVRFATTSGLPGSASGLMNFSGTAGTQGILELAAGNISYIFGTSSTTNGFRINSPAGSSGFAAVGGDRTVTMNNGANDVTWSTSGGNSFAAGELILATANSTGKLTLTHSNAGSGKGLRFTNTSGTTTRTIRADNGSAAIDAEIAMPLLDGASAGQVGAFTKTGAGVLALTAVNTYTGPTTVSAGGLLVNGTTAAASAFTVSSGAFLGGIGRVGGAVTINGGIAPGSNGIGTLTTGSGVTWNAGNAWLFQLGTPAASLNAASSSTDNDLLNVAGAFQSGTGSTFTFDFANTGSDGWYKLIDYTTTNFATGTNTSFTANNVPSGKTANFVVDSASSALYVQIVPEPSTIALAAFGALTCLWACRRRRTA